MTQTAGKGEQVMKASHSRGGFLQACVFVALALCLAVLIPRCILLPEADFTGEHVPNERPVVRITGGVLEDSLDTETQIHFYWYGADEDGVIHHFEWAVDDTISQNAWRTTTFYDQSIPFTSSTGDSAGQFTEWHTFYIRSVDDQGLTSRPDRRYFNSSTIAPTTEIIQPVPEQSATWASTLRISWKGEDLDAASPDKLPLSFEVKHIRAGDINVYDKEEVRLAFEDRDNLLLGDLDPDDYPDEGGYLDEARSAWKRVAGSVDTEWLYEMIAGQFFGFAVRAIDEAGAREVEMVRSQNWVIFNVGDRHISIWISEPALGVRHFNTPAFGEPWKVTVAPEQTFRFQWIGDASASGTEAGPCNYGFDIPDPSDQSEPFRAADGMGGWIGWAPRDRMQRAVSFPTADEGKSHFFYLKMRDVSRNQLTETQCAIEIKVAEFSFARKFLVVDDLRGAPKACLGNPPYDEFTDAWRERVFVGMNEYLPPGESPTTYDVYGINEPTTGDPNIPEDFLDFLGGYQTVIWDCGHSRESGFARAARKLYLSQYIGVGGNLLCYVFQGPVTDITMAFPFEYLRPKCAAPDLLRTDFYWNRFSFLWQMLHLRECVDKASGNSTQTRNPKTLIAADAYDPDYPDLALDTGTGKWSCGSTYRGILNYECLVPLVESDEIDPWYLRDPGLEILYTGVSLSEDSKLNGRPVAWRTMASAEDFEAGLDRGRIVCFGFHPYYFEDAGVERAMTRALNWLITGSDN
jgi:hypothetical protein